MPIQEKCAGVLEVTIAEIGAMFVQMGVLIQSVLFEGVSTKEGLLALIPETLDSNLRSLIVKVIAGNLSTWRDLSSNNECKLLPIALLHFIPESMYLTIFAKAS